MSKMILLELTLRNFKGVKEFILKTNGTNVKIFGDNATGKTTLFDAFNWLLFDKDSQNKKDFEIKTLEDGVPIHFLNHEVEGVFKLNGRNLVLKKVYAEKWTKRRGSSQQEFGGHTTDYFIDEVPSTKKKYTDLISSIVDEGIFKLLTSPNYFNEQLHWQKRRETLLEVCGNITDQEVISSDKKLIKLSDILINRTVDDHKKVIVAKRKQINEELERIPVRIDEATRSIPDLSELEEGDIEQELTFLQSEVEEKQSELSRIQNGGEVSAKEKRLREIEGELLDIKNKLNSDTHQKLEKKREDLYLIQNQVDRIQRTINNKEHLINSNEKEIKLHSEAAQKLREQWYEINGQIFSFENHQTECPACGQSLPDDKIEETKQKAEAHFNREKSEKLEGIGIKGKTLKNSIEVLEEQNRTLTAEVESAKQEVTRIQKEIQEVQQDIGTLQSSVKSVESDTTYQEKQKEAEEVKKEIQDLRLSVNDTAQGVREEIKKLKNDIEKLYESKGRFSNAKALNERIEQLSKQERELAKEFEALEEELFLCEEFTRSKVNLLEKKINSKFKYARFKLFSEQINGGLQETCETLFEGVPYGGGLNNAARINVGLDIINTLSEHYGFYAPIFIDNSEAITRLIDVDSQVVSLVVSEKDKQLRVETDPEDLKEAI